MKRQSKWVISDSARQALESCELFQDLSAQQLLEIAALVEECSLDADEMLLREGQPAQHLFVVIEGRGTAQIEMYRGWLSLGLVGPNDSAGWSSLVDGHVYPASVKTLTAMRVARIETKGLALLMNLTPAVGHSISMRLSALFCRQYQAALEAFRSSD